MNTFLIIICVFSIIFIVGFIAIKICKAGTINDYNRAVKKCVDCEYFWGRDRKHRLIYCKLRHFWLTPEKCLGCREKVKIKK